VIRRLRPMPTDAELAEMYAKPHDHTKWFDHELRVGMTTVLTSAFYTKENGTIVDLSCGDAAIARDIAELYGGTTVLGDIAPGYEYHGPIETTLNEFGGTRERFADLFICTETLEHLNNPEHVLSIIRECAGMLVISTPIGAHDDENPEHMWSWDDHDVITMCANTEWRRKATIQLELRPSGYVYDYFIGVFV
jgi:hypothetical protein